MLGPGVACRARGACPSVTVAANPVLSAPDGDRLDKALDSLDFMVSVDPYLGETARHADVVLPPHPPSQAPHFDFAFNAFAVHHQVRYNRAAVPLEDGRMAETEILARLTLAATGRHGADRSQRHTRRAGPCRGPHRRNAVNWSSALIARMSTSC